MGQAPRHFFISQTLAGCQQLCSGSLNSEKLCRLALAEHLTSVTLWSKVLWEGIPAPCYTHSCQAIYLRLKHSMSRAGCTRPARRLTVTAGICWGLSCSFLLFVFKKCLSCSYVRSSWCCTYSRLPRARLGFPLPPRSLASPFPCPGRSFPKLHPSPLSIKQGS